MFLRWYQHFQKMSFKPFDMNMKSLALLKNLYIPSFCFYFLSNPSMSWLFFDFNKHFHIHMTFMISKLCTFIIFAKSGPKFLLLPKFKKSILSGEGQGSRKLLMLSTLSGIFWHECAPFQRSSFRRCC